MLGAAWATAVFNVKRSLKPAHGFWLVGLALFPTLLGWLVVESTPELVEDARLFMPYVYVTVVRVVAPLALLLWATPAVHNELENGTWQFVSFRPKGRIGLFLGSYLSAVFWALIAGWGGLVLATLLLRPAEPLLVLRIVGELTLWSAVAYGALYSLIGVLFLKRGIPIAVGVTLIFEVLVTFANAVLNELTVAFRLHSIGFERVRNSDLQIPNERHVPDWLKLAAEDSSGIIHIGALLLYTALLLAIGATVLHRRELVLAER